MSDPWSGPAGRILGIPIPPKKLVPKRGAMIRGDPRSNAERKRTKKNESGRRETERTGAAMSAIAEHFGTEGASRREILARLVEEGGLSESCARFSKS